MCVCVYVRVFLSRADVDEIGYKFICPFRRDIVLLPDKVKGGSNLDDEARLRHWIFDWQQVSLYVCV